jgi:Zn-dependent protease with chaperone function
LSLSLWLRSVLAVALLVLFPVLVVGGALAVVVAGVLVARSVPLVGAKIGLLALPALWALVSSVRATLRARRQPVPPAGPRLGRREHPALWAELDRLADELGQPPLESVEVGLAVNAGIDVRRRAVMLGLPILVGMNRAELRAVLAHEFGHAAGGHRAAYAAEGVLGRLTVAIDRPVLRRLARIYHRLYQLVASSVLRDHERQADETAARVAGPRVLGDALATLCLLDAAWDRLVDEYLIFADGAKARPSAVTGLHALLTAGPPDLRQEAKSRIARPASRYDSHPATHERIARLYTMPQPGPDSYDDRPAWTLLGDGAGTLAALEAALGVTDGPAGSWDDALRESLVDGARATADRTLDQLVERIPGTGRSLSWMLHVLRNGHAHLVVKPLMRGDVPAPHRGLAASAMLVSAVEAVVVSTVAAQGRLHVAVDWTAPPEPYLVDAGGGVRPWPFHAAIEAAVADPMLVGKLENLLAAHGVQMDLPLLSQTPAGPPPSLPVAAVGPVVVRPHPDPRRKVQAYDVGVYDDGVLMHPVPRDASRFTLTAVVGAGPGRHRERLGRLADTVGAHPGAWAERAGDGTRWVPFDRVASARAGTTLKGTRFRLELVYGGRLDLQATGASGTLGNPEAVLRRAVGR